MTRVIADITMSLDGFIAGPNDGPEHPLGEGGMRLFDWYSSGDTDYVVPTGGMTFKVSSAHEEGGDRVYAVSTNRFVGDPTRFVATSTRCPDRP